MEDGLDELDRRRAATPVGCVLSGTVVWVPRPVGVIGVGVDLGLPVRGFVDVLQLPRDPDRWPEVGDTMTFQVLQHREHQVRLCPEDSARRRDPMPPWRQDAEWDAVKALYPIGVEIDATVGRVFRRTRECIVDDGRIREGAEWSGDVPVVGARITVRVEGHLEPVRRLVLRRSAP